jgi:hypothetical protein
MEKKNKKDFLSNEEAAKAHLLSIIKNGFERKVDE